MKKKYTFLLVTICFSLQSQVINFPDVNFKTKLLSSNTSNAIAVDNNNNNIKIDANNDGEIEVNEALQVSKLFYVSNSNGETPSKSTNSIIYPITDLTGISFFSNLKYLNVNSNNLTTLDLSNNVLLEELYCINNQLNALNLTNLNNLSVLNISENSLNSLNTVLYSNLVYLNCSNNNFTSLSLSNNLNLVTLRCSYNNLQNLDVTNNLFLTILYCNNNNINSLQISNQSDLQYLDFSGNLITSFNFTDFINLKNINCASNQLNSLIFNNNQQLQYLYCPGNNLTNLDVSQTNLKYLNCSDNSNLTFINMKNTVISPQYNESIPLGPPNFPSFNFSNLPSLNYLCFDDGEEEAIQTGFSGTIPNNVQLSTSCALETNDNFMSNNLIISPNPATNSLFIKVNNNTEIQEISIYSVLGQLVKNIKRNVNSIDINDLNNGIYFILVDTTNGREIQKFLKN